MSWAGAGRAARQLSAQQQISSPSKCSLGENLLFEEQLSAVSLMVRGWKLTLQAVARRMAGTAGVLCAQR